VQGVGFRYTAQALAAGYPVAGYVRNLRDGRVELVAQGEPEQVDAFLGAVDRNMAGYIDGVAVHDEPPGSYQGFSIRR
jgi:acylphosphatase